MTEEIGLPSPKSNEDHTMLNLPNRFLACIFLGLLGIVAAGCGPADPKSSGGKKPSEDEHVGPHKGHIIELGRDHRYHGELVHNDATQTVSVYILGKGMKEHAIDQKSATITITIGDQTTTHDLAAVDPVDGKTAHFRGDKKLFEAIEAVEKNPRAKARFAVTIDGTPYSGEVELEEHGH